MDNKKLKVGINILPDDVINKIRNIYNRNPITQPYSFPHHNCCVCKIELLWYKDNDFSWELDDTICNA
tara:strand:- start:96 stop:299 length:204 start_codon:yes stop_codon:yes gene_type:complete